MKQIRPKSLDLCIFYLVPPPPPILGNIGWSATAEFVSFVEMTLFPDSQGLGLGFTMGVV